MTYKVTALKTVTIRAYVRGKTAVRIGGQIAMKPSERDEWIQLKAGEVRDGLGLVIGVHPSSLPDHVPTHIHGIATVLSEGWSPDDLPKEFNGLYRLEVSE